MPLVSQNPQAGGGGSQPVQVVKVPITPATPNLVLTGIPIFTPTAGQFMWYYGTSFLSVQTAWDGNTPVLHFGYAASLSAYDSQFGSGPINLASADVPQAGGHVAAVGTPIPNASSTTIFLDAEPLTVMVDDGAGGDPGSTHGSAVIYLVVGG